MTGIASRWRRILATGLCGPFVVAACGVLLLAHALTAPTLGVPEGAYGPLSWPVFSLGVLVAGMALLCVFRLRDFHRHGPGPAAALEADTLPGRARVPVAAALIALYGAAFVFAGFLFATIAFLAAWLVFTRYRHPLRVVLVSVLGTVLPLYLLIKVAYMPLPRGAGVLEDATILLYQWLRLF